MIDEQSIHDEVGRRLEEKYPGRVVWVPCGVLCLPTVVAGEISTASIVENTTTRARIAGDQMLENGR